MTFPDIKRGLWTAPVVMVVSVLAGGSAFAQGNSVITGTVRDAATKAPVADVVVTATSPALQGEQIVVTDGTGSYRIPQLPPGDYTIRLEKETYKPNARGGVTLRVGSTIRLNIELIPEAIKGEEITVVGRPPTVDVGSTQTGTTVGSEFVSRIALSPPSVKGSSTRSFESLADVAPTAHTDGYGMSISGTTSPENQYIIDGLSVNDPGFGLLGTPLSAEFIKEVNIITGGYMPEYGRATGGVLDAVTKSGSNEFHGSIFLGITPGALEGAKEIVKRDGQTITLDTSLSSLRDFGLEIGGPIMKDKLWFYAGFQPSFTRYKIDRYLSAKQVTNGVVNTDPETNFTIVKEIPGTRQTYYADGRAFQYIGKLTYLINQDHNVTLSVYGSPSSSGGKGTFGIDPQTGDPETESVFAGTYDAIAHTYTANSTDIALKWASSFLNKNLLFDATLGWHHANNSVLPVDGTEVGGTTGLAGTAQALYRKTVPDRHNIAEFETIPINGATGLSYCEPVLDSSGTAYINVCPVSSYRVGGPGFIDTQVLDRYQAKAVVTRLLTALGHHVIKAGVDIELMSYEHDKGYTGTTIFGENGSGTQWSDSRRYGFLQGPDDPVILKKLTAAASSTTIGGFVQDSWNILDKVTLNAGVRYDTQIITGADGKVGLSLPNQWSPRVGVIYDFTQAGRSKLFVNFARYYESVPLDIGDRAFGGERQFQTARRAKTDANPTGCDPSTMEGQQADACTKALLPRGTVFNGPQTVNQQWFLTSADTTPVDPDISPQSSDELVVGGEYEIIPDGRVGVQYTKRYMNAIIEDMSRNDGVTYFVGNPGSGIATDFPQASRDYDAVTLYFNKSFSNQWLAQASYTVSYLRGNWAGLFRAENGQLDPNINSTFDLVSLLPNSEGPLNGDRTHQLKVFGAKDFSVTKWLNINVGLTFRTRSGEPTSYYGAHPVYGADEAFILQRGAAERLPWVHNFDSHVGFAFKLSKESELSVGIDIFNLFNFQGVTGVDETYTSSSVLPIVDDKGATGTTKDLPTFNADGSCVAPCKLRVIDDATGLLRDPVKEELNPNFGHPNAYQAPRTFRFSAKVSF